LRIIVLSLVQSDAWPEGHAKIGSFWSPRWIVVVTTLSAEKLGTNNGTVQEAFRLEILMQQDLHFLS